MKKTNLLGCASLVSILAAAPALAQQVASAADGLAEEIVVTGRPLADSNAAALAMQRNSNSLVSVLSADSVGNLPDQNIAFAVGRLPGVAIERDQGQARYVNLRGAPVYWTTLSFDGLSVVSPQGRDSRFDNIPSAIASQITVEKAVLPSMAAASVAGNVDIRTRRAFDYDGQKITANSATGTSSWAVVAKSTARWSIPISSSMAVSASSGRVRSIAAKWQRITGKRIPILATPPIRTSASPVSMRTSTTA